MAKNNKKSSNSFLKRLPPKDREMLLEQSTICEFKKGDHIVRAMDRDTNLYIINSGTVRVSLYSDDGKEVSFIDIGSGGNFGEISAIDGQPRSANVIALTDANILIVSAKEFLKLLSKNPELCIELLNQLTAIIRRLCDRIFEYATLDVNKRIYLELLRLGREHVDYDGIARILNPPTHVELASRVSCTREAISRVFNKLEKAGIIIRHQKRLVIGDIQRLQELLENVAA